MSNEGQSENAATTPSIVISVVALIWICVGAGISALVEIVYLPMWWGSVPAPVTILLAAIGSVAFVWAASAWTKSLALTLLPIVIWFLVYLFMMFPGPGGDSVLVPSGRGLLLLVAGVLPGVIMVYQESLIRAERRGRVLR